MGRTWEQEKEYSMKRSADLMQEMDLAILRVDKVRFQRAFQTVMRYMSRKDLAVYMHRYCMAQMDERRAKR